MVDTVKTDIQTSIEQEAALQAMSTEGNWIDSIRRMQKMRKQMEIKLDEFNQKLDRQKKNHSGLQRLQIEYEEKLRGSGRDSGYCSPTNSRVVRSEETYKDYRSHQIQLSQALNTELSTRSSPGTNPNLPVYSPPISQTQSWSPSSHLEHRP